MTTAEKLEQAMAQAPDPAHRPPLAGVVHDVLGALGAGMRIRPDAEVDESDRVLRRNDALPVRDRLPRALRSQDVVARLRLCHPEIVAAARAWRPGDGNLLLLGETGEGKSTAAAYVFRRVLGYGIHHGGAAWDFARQLHWFHALDLQEARLRHPRGSGGYPPEIAAACGATLLVIDDVGKEHFRESVEEVLSARYDDGLPTIVTANLTYPRGFIAKGYDEAIVRKLVETGGRDATIVDLLATPAGGTP